MHAGHHRPWLAFPRPFEGVYYRLLLGVARAIHTRSLALRRLRLRLRNVRYILGLLLLLLLLLLLGNGQLIVLHRLQLPFVGLHVLRKALFLLHRLLSAVTWHAQTYITRQRTLRSSSMSDLILAFSYTPTHDVGSHDGCPFPTVSSRLTAACMSCLNFAWSS